MKREKVREELYKTNVDFKRARDRHQECEKELEDIQNRRFVTQKEQLHSRNLKKEKLILKDKMEKLIDAHSNS